MLSLTNKISHLENYLTDIQDSFADSFKTDILFYFDEFETPNKRLSFLHHLTSVEEIEHWVDGLSSSIVLKFDEETEQLNDFIDDYLKH